MSRYAGYLGTLRSIGDPARSEWKAVAVGLVVLRLVDDWLESGPRGVAANPTSLVTAREVIAQVCPRESVKPLLVKITNSLAQIERKSLSDIAVPIISYTRTLQERGLYALSKEAITTLHQHAKRTNNGGTIAKTAVKLALAHRIAADFDVAEEYYRTALYYFQRDDKRFRYFHTSLGIAMIRSTQGNFSDATTLCTDAARAAKKIDNQELLGMALHNQACVLISAGEDESAIRLLYQVTGLIKTTAGLEAARGDLASMLTTHGQIDEVRPLLTTMAVNARESVMRWQSIINLMRTASTESNAVDFELYRSALELAPLPPWSAMWYHWFLAKGYCKFGKLSLADQEANTARAVAEQYKIKSIHLE